MTFIKSVSLISFEKYRAYFPYFIALVSVLIYANTLTHDYTQDDAIAIYDNEFTTQGLSGIDDIFSHDTFYGFFGENKSGLVSGGRYRPLTLTYFAILWEAFGHSPLSGHLSNIFLYALLCVIIYHFLVLLRPIGPRKYLSVWALVISLIFTIHPIHTEVVANIKGLDEIWALTFGILSIYCALKYFDHSKTLYLALSGLFIFLGLLSKENAIIFCGLVPMTLWYFRKAHWKKILTSFGVVVVFAGAYLLIRFSILDLSFGRPPLELMNNPFLKVIDGVYYPFTTSEKWATILFGLGKYIQLLFFPHPLTHDYYPRQFDVMTLGDAEVWLSIVMVISVLFFAFVDLKKKSVVSYAVFIFLAGIVLTSNIIFPIGTHISERFLFTPSLGFAILAGHGITNIYKKGFSKFALSLMTIFVLLFCMQTITRNRVWKNDFTLFTTDVHISMNSAKVRNAAGGALLAEANKIADKEQQSKIRAEAKTHLQKAIEIHPNYKNAHLLLGNAHFGLEEYDDAIRSYERALQLEMNYKIAEDNLVLAYREGARYEGSQKGNISKAIQYLINADLLLPGDYETISLLGIAHGNSGQHNEALRYFVKALELQPNNAQANLNLASAYFNLGDEEKGNFYKSKAAQLQSRN